ncbi:MAG: polysaccharide deacetylase family protein [Nitrospiraceae bacterium]
MQAKMHTVNTKAKNTSDIPETEMYKNIQVLEKQPIHWAPARVPSEPSDGPRRLHPLPSQSCQQWHFTIDADWVPGSEVGLEGLLDFCDRWKLKATIFVAGRFAEAYPDLVRECRRRGHELGTHGWEHGGLEQDEDFRSASYDQQRAWIRLATEAVEKAAGVRPVVFRAPSLWIGETTLRALEEEGYRYDSSVPARRFDCGFGRVHYLKYFRAPTEPYRLSSSHLRLPGHSSIIEMAPSAFLFPINMATLRVLGLPMMKWMLRGISRRASRLVFYCHPYEFVQAHRQSFPRNMSKWNMKGMTPENLSLLDRFVEHVMLQGYAPTLFAGSFGASQDTRPLTRGTTRLRSESVDDLGAHAASLPARDGEETHTVAQALGRRR